jgi:hypothetical protein
VNGEGRYLGGSDEEGRGNVVRGLEGHGSGLEGVWGGEGLGRGRMDREGLKRVGGVCEALYLDLMVVRDEGMFLVFFSLGLCLHVIGTC